MAGDASLLGLPAELKGAVLEYLTSYRDKKSTCRVCKELHLVGTPYLYRDMVITTQVLTSFYFSMTIDFVREWTPRIPVRTLRILHFSIDNENFKYGQGGITAIHQLLSAIPENSLTHLELPVPQLHQYCPNWPSWELVAKIDQRQRRLANYQYIGFHHRDRDWNEFEVENKYLASIRHLQFSLHNRRMCELADNVLTCMRNLTRLDVEGQLSISDDTNLAIWQFIVRTFGVEHELPQLKSLRLKGLRIIHDDDAVPQLPGLRDLEHLQLILCCDYVPLLLMLRTLPLSLKSFTICEGGYEVGEDFDGDADEFVRSLNSLQRLSLILDRSWDGSFFNWTALYAQAAGIKSLQVQCTSEHRLLSHDQDASDFRHFCTKASSLQQLSLSGITIQSSMPIFSAFENGAHSLAYLIDCLHTVRALKVLKLVVYFSALQLPTAEELRSRRDTEQHWRQRLAKSTADKVLSELANSCPELMAVVIEIEDDRIVALQESDPSSGGNFDDDDDNWTMPKHEDATYAFIRSKQTDLYGNTSIVGMAVETRMVKHYEPCSDILDLIGSYPSEH